MSLVYADTINDFEYKGIRVQIIIHFDNKSDDNTLYRIEFEYKTCRMFDWYYRDDNDDAYSLTRTYCRIIDKYGSEGANNYKSYKEKISEIKYKYIIIDCKVYKFDKAVMDINPHKMHMMSIKMTDGKILDGDSSLNNDFYIKEKDSYSYKKTLDNLRSKVEDYFNAKKILPHEEYLLADVTDKYNELQLEYKKIIE